MPVTVPITLDTSTMGTVTAVSVTNVLRSDTGLAPAGISLPIALSQSPTNVWTGSFTDTIPPPSYAVTATLVVNGSASGPFSYTLAYSVATSVAVRLAVLPSASSASILAAYRADTGLPPVGTSFPVALTYVAPYWIGTFDDNPPATTYKGSGVITLPDGNVITFPVVIKSGQIQVIGFWTSQPAIEDFIGVFSGDQLSNLDNDSVQASPGGFADAIVRAESVTNLVLRQFYYPSGNTSPTFPSSSYAFDTLALNTTVTAAAWIYAKRGSYDQNDQIAGKFARAESRARLEIKQCIVNKILDVSRNLNGFPTLIFNPALVPFGTSNPVPLSGNMIPSLPGSPTTTGGNANV